MYSNTAKEWGASANPGKAFEGVKEALEKECKRLGENAVVFCQFEYRNALEAKLIGKRQSSDRNICLRYCCKI